MLRKSLPFLLALCLSACGGDDDPGVDASPQPDANLADANATPDGAATDATVEISWEITKGGNAATCADVGASTVEVTATRTGGGSFTGSWPCDGMTGSLPVQSGTHQFAVTVVDAGGNVLGSGPVGGPTDVPTGATLQLQLMLQFQ